MVYNYTKPRVPIAAMYSGPGPSYGLPGLVGHPKHDPRSGHYRNPAYSFGVKHGKWRDDCSPGPAHLPMSKIYKDGKDGTPHYSLYSRRKDLTAFHTPGPGAHSPETSGQSAYARHPAYSFGARTRLRRTDDSPAPNAYALDPMMGRTVRAGKRQAPIYSMRPKSVVGSFTEDLSKTPGPGTYGVTSADIYKGQQPKYSMTGRNQLPGDRTSKPGPGAHSPERVYVNKKSAPNFSFGIRHSAYVAPLIVDPAY
eukprot:GHVR01081292.1.p1 GENE.GHVR01081292.1~~GHVR01081292.1.p1  ORF type:complete len:253 (-),score=5.14 GHVR01081292.1:720-1478(-)